MPRFVLLRHTCPHGYVKPSHWDFMLEADDQLMTWELRELPAAWGGSGGATTNVIRLPDHRLAYLDYEGTVSGDRGSVHRIASGTFEMVEHTEHKIRAMLNSPTICGVIELIDAGGDWQLVVTGHDEA
jgi:hypothetical protein